MMRAGLLACCLSLVALLGGCASGGTKTPASQDPGRNGQINSWLGKQALDVPGDVYRVQPPDAIKVVAPGIKELDAQVVKIRPDGKVTFNLLGDVAVAGKTPAEIAQVLTDAAAKFYQKDSINVSVIVTEFKSKVVYVFGQVIEPGIKPYTGRNTVLGVLAEAKLNTLAWPQKVIIVRPNEDKNIKQKVTVDLKVMYESGSTDQNFLLEEGDIIYVPPSPLAQMGITFNKVLFPIVPVGNLASMAAGL